jgi:hypothetical protein
MAAAKPTDRITLDYAFAAPPTAMIIDSRLSPPAFRLWCVLYMLAWTREDPATEALQVHMRQGDILPTRRSIYRWLAELEACGWLDWQRAPGKAGANDRFTLLTRPVTLRSQEQPAAQPVIVESQVIKPVIVGSQVAKPVTPESQPVIVESQVVSFSALSEQPKDTPKIHENHGSSSSSGARAILRKCGIYNGTIRQVLALGIDEDTLIASVEALHRAGWGAGAITNELRDNPPMKGHPYEQPQSGLGSPAAQAGAARPAPRSPERARRSAGSHNPTGGAELHNPGWQQKELDRIQKLYNIPDSEM